MKVLYVRFKDEVLHAACTAAARAAGFSLTADWARRELAKAAEPFVAGAALTKLAVDDRQASFTADGFPPPAPAGSEDPSPEKSGERAAKPKRARASKSKPQASASKARKASKRKSARKSTTPKTSRRGKRS